jgi:hypothetical protein
MGGNGIQFKTKDGNLRWVAGSAFGIQPQDGDNKETYQFGFGASLVGLAPKRLGFVYAVPNYTQAPGQKQVGVLFGGGVDLLISTFSAGLNPGLNLKTGDFSLGAEISIGPLIGINKNWALLPAFKMSWPDLLSDVGNNSAFYGFQLAISYGHLPADD